LTKDKARSRVAKLNEQEVRNKMVNQEPITKFILIVHLSTGEKIGLSSDLVDFP
jgi:hypothetical protein